MSPDRPTLTVATALAAYPPDALRTYALSDIDQLTPVRLPDIVDGEPRTRMMLARELAIDATIFGLPSVLQYGQMYEQAIDASHPRWVGFNQFAHDDDLAGPGYEAFKTPNVDTLYSNAWLDLTGGPKVIDIPAFGSRYYTLHFLDMYSNSSNLSLRTAGPPAHRFLGRRSVGRRGPPQATLSVRDAICVDPSPSLLGRWP